jgi:capsular exopolysaccharide synthesis family protein
MLGVDANKGVVNYIMGDCTMEEIAFQVKHPNFHVVTAGSIPPNPGEMLTDEKVLTLMNELKKRYDVIVIDFAPIGFVTDLFQISEMLDSVLFVVRDRFTDKNWLKSALEELKAHELKGVGLVINGIRMKKGSYLSGGYGYGYGYGYSYGYGYGYGYGDKKTKVKSGRKVVKQTA